MHMQMHGCSYVLIKSLLNIMSHDNEWMCNNIRYTNLETRKTKQTGYFSSMNVECSLNLHSTAKCTHSVKFIQFGPPILSLLLKYRPICLTLWMFCLDWRTFVAVTATTAVVADDVTGFYRYCSIILSLHTIWSHISMRNAHTKTFLLINRLFAVLFVRRCDAHSFVAFVRSLVCHMCFFFLVVVVCVLFSLTWTVHKIYINLFIFSKSHLKCSRFYSYRKSLFIFLNVYFFFPVNSFSRNPIHIYPLHKIYSISLNSYWINMYSGEYLNFVEHKIENFWQISMNSLCNILLALFSYILKAEVKRFWSSIWTQ